LLKARLVHLFLARPVHLLLSYTSVTMQFHFGDVEMARCLLLYAPTALLLFDYDVVLIFEMTRWLAGCCTS